MRKKIAMRKGGKVSKYAEGGRVGGPRPQENRRAMAAAAAPGFDAEEEALMARRAARRAAPSLITNNPAGTNTARGMLPVGASRPSLAEPAPYESVAQPESPLPMPPPAPPRARQRTAMARSRSREVSADELNEREMTRILNDRSLEAAQNGRAMYRKGGKVKGCK